MNKNARSRIYFAALILFHFVLIMATTTDVLGDFGTTDSALWLVLVGWGVFFFLITRKETHEKPKPDKQVDVPVDDWTIDDPGDEWLEGKDYS